MLPETRRVVQAKQMSRVNIPGAKFTFRIALTEVDLILDPLCGTEPQELVTGAFPHGHSGTAAKNILLRAARARDTDGADDGDTVENRHRAAHGHHPSAMGNH